MARSSSSVILQCFWFFKPRKKEEKVLVIRFVTVVIYSIFETWDTLQELLKN